MKRYVDDLIPSVSECDLLRNRVYAEVKKKREKETEKERRKRKEEGAGGREGGEEEAGNGQRPGDLELLTL